MASDLTQNDPKADVSTVEPTRGQVTFSPRIDIRETEEELILYADLPGVTAEDLDIQFENRELRIHGRVRPRQARPTYLYREYGVGDFFRTFAIGEEIDHARISAELSKGELILHLPKTEAVKPRRITVSEKK
jgi:HSP20 family protein